MGEGARRGDAYRRRQRLLYPEHSDHARRLPASGFALPAAGSLTSVSACLFAAPGEFARRTALREHGVVGILLHRIIHSLGVLLVVTSAVFAIVHLDGDPTAGFIAPGASPEDRAAVRERFGLDRPLPAQYATYLSHAARADFGESWRARRPAMDAVLERLPATLRLAGAALALAVLAGVPLGIAAGRRPGGPLDLIASTTALLGQAVPGFILGTLLILAFAVHLKWLPSSGGDGWRALVLPAVTLAAYPTAIVARLLRGSLIEALGEDYVRTARGKGLSEHAIVYAHALRNAALPTLAYVGLQAGFLIGGAVVVEGVFAYPGIGQLALGAVTDRDLPVIQAVTVVIAAAIVAINLLVDLIAGMIDPRLRIAEGSR
jgi:peptide/nickel transport system permease protein